MSLGQEAGAQASHSDMASAIRVLSMDAVEKAKSGHPGMPMGFADVATVLFTRFLKFNADKPNWPDRDRFVLSAGHGSMLQYSLLYLTGYPEMDANSLSNFRQLHSNTPGHPEFGDTIGVETTTGPLGQGLANAVGMALAERMLNARYGDKVFNHRTYAVVGDGCLMEGISQEAITLAGHLKLGKLITLFDDNEISIDGSTELSTSDDQIKRFEAAGWHVARVDGHDPEAIAAAIQNAQNVEDKPSMIACRTVIGQGAPNKKARPAYTARLLVKKKSQTPVRLLAGQQSHSSFLKTSSLPGEQQVAKVKLTTLSGTMLGTVFPKLTALRSKTR